MKGVRSAVRRVGRQCSFRLLPETQVAPGLLDAAQRAAATAGARARPSAASRWSSAATSRGDDPDLLLAVATAPDGRPLGFLRLVPCFGEEPGWSLDLMQHDPTRRTASPSTSSP